MSTIKVIPNPDTFKVSRIEYINCNFIKEIEVFVATTSKNTDQTNKGTILEDYRKLTEGRNEFYAKHKNDLDGFINSIKPAFKEFNPEYTISFLPHDTNRCELLNAFAERVKNPSPVNAPIDISACFHKTDPTRSIKDGLTEDNYVLRNTDKLPIIQNLLIIDDVIDKGDTVKIFLDKLFAEGKIDAATTIKMACIYNNPKMEKAVDIMALLREKAKNKNNTD